MRLYADVFNTAGTRLGGGPVLLTSANVARVLDGIGTIQISAPGTDPRALALLTNERQVKIYYQPADDIAVREIGRGTIRRVRASGSPSDWTLDCEGPDDLDGLARFSTKLRRIYSAETVEDIVDDLVTLASGWSATASGGNTTDCRFDGVSVYNAILGLVEQQGLHVRAGTSAKTVEVGAFGSSSGLRLVNAVQAGHHLDDSDELVLIERITVEQDSEAVCTRLYPLGAGIGEAWLTIEKATRNLPYTRQVVNVNGIDQHFLEDFTAVAAYGVIEKMGKFTDIAPLSNSVTDVENAANALYDMAAAWLSRYAQRLDAYRVTVRKVRSTVRPGDKVRLVYNGVVVNNGAVTNYIDVDDDFWVMEAVEYVGLEGETLELTLASVDRHPSNAAGMVIGALEELKIDGVSVKPYFNQAPVPHNLVIDADNPAIVPLHFTNAVQRISRVTMRVKTSPFISTVAPAVTNSLHRHTMFIEDPGTDYGGDSGNRTYYWRKLLMYDDTSTPIFALLPVSVETADMTVQTGTETNEDFIGIEYGLHADTETPDTLRIYVNDTDYTTALGGPFAVSTGATTFDVDLTTAIETEAGGTIQQEFEIKITCDSGQGQIWALVDVYDIIQAIAVS